MKRFISMILLAMMLLTVVPFSSFTVSAAEEKLPFTDVKETDWFYEAVDYTYANGIFKGTNSAGTLFSPGNAMTRAQFATTLFRLSGANEADYQGESKFPDVPSNDWMTAAANWASEKGYVEGNNKGEFMPSKTLNRQTLATMLYRYAKDEYDTSVVRQTAFDRFGDKNDTADWAKDAMTWMVTVELINGTGANVKGAPTLAPAKTATRGQVAQILMNYANLQYYEDYNVGDILIGDTSISEYIIVYSSSAANPAKEFQKYIKMATGFELDLVQDTNCEIGTKEILIGQTNREGVTVNIDRSKCMTDNEAFVYGVQNGNLYITSNENKLGTAYGTYDFLEHYAGINFFGVFETVDVKKTFEVPADLNYFETSATNEFRVYYSNNYGSAEKWKCNEVNGIRGFYHALPSLGMDPSEFKADWSFQAEVHKNADPCLTTAKSQQNIITNAKKLAGGNGLWLGHSDGAGYCKCSSCAAYIREHGRMGPYFNILDVVADALEKDFPNVKILGLAYSHTWNMLKGFDRKDINKNVTYVVCGDNMCGTHSITSTGCKNESNPNNTYEKDYGYKVETVYGYKDCFDKIVELCPTIYIWDYIYPANHNEQPIPLFHRMYDNFTYFFENGACGFFLQNTTDDNACFDVMRCYMAAKLLRDGENMTEDQYWGYIQEFMKEYYGDGWTYIYEYINYMYELSQENEWHIWSNEDWNDIITEEQYRENFDYLMGLWEKAESLAQTEEMATRVRRDSTQMKYIELCLAYETYADSAMTAEDLAKYTALRDAYVEILETYGFEMPNISNLNPAFWRYS
ncbi:MAG: DUF4838 domain-containing protein [Ruminococcaceae bacterium]|nr:DUF4838 domain-containing protein [Oscillospiraceae bacterium]